MNIVQFAILFLILLVGRIFADDPGIISAGDTIKKFFQDQTPKVNEFFNDINNIYKNIESLMVEYGKDQTPKVNEFFNDISNIYKNIKSLMVEYGNDIKQSIQETDNDINKSLQPVKKKIEEIFGPPFPITYSHTTPRNILDNPDVALSVPAIISRNGYPCETHTVMSQGYLLSVHRVPRGAVGRDVPQRTVLLQHGLFASSADWVLNGPGRALAYVLADAGYDVWMPNIRGNRYSKEHAWLKTDSKAYWDFSWHDIAMHDVPEIIDYIMKTKGNDTQLFYVGHSMGATILFAMLSLRPEYNALLKAGFVFAPEVFITDFRSPLASLAPIAADLAQMAIMTGNFEFTTKIFNPCAGKSVKAVICNFFQRQLDEYDWQKLNETMLAVVNAHAEKSTSWKTIVHYAQEINAGGKFQQFDYGPSDNRVWYSSESSSPSEYDLSRVTTPIVIFWSENDWLCSESEVRLLHSRLRWSTMYKISDPNFSHHDYFYSKQVQTVLNDYVLTKLTEYTHQKDSFII